MKISDLIKNLKEIQSQSGDIEIVLSITDHTDWTYNFDFPGFDIGTVYDEDSKFDSDSDYCVCEVSI